ncbi:4-alpha-glucanotransferase (amylomaltase) [Chitinispirillum alkaliphilum]|nr:4-alpha-glucanotransferase (amylomaltase) [Chitinispirillum alkaliphilum]
MRASGIFLHPTSLPSRYGIGDMGENAMGWIDLLASRQQTYWQVCPLGPTGYGDSPYQTLCSFAGNTLLISPDELLSQGLLKAEEVEAFPHLSDNAVDYGNVITEKEKLFLRAFSRFTGNEDFQAFCKQQNWWLHDYALFRVIKESQSGKPWWLWEKKYKLRQKAAIRDIEQTFGSQLLYHKFLQYVFHSQWDKLREYAGSKKIRIIGDLPYYTAYDSSDTWAEPKFFEFDKSGKPIRVAGVPPDYFSETGQLWGNPLYRWDVMKKDNYSWWVRRLRKTLEMVDLIRLDHFRAFESYWAVPADHDSAINGVWEKGPGFDFFRSVKKQLGELPLIAEDLGVITPQVLELREQVNAPGMKILQFAFDGKPDNPYLPYNIPKDSVTYTGTHDNDTSLGWFNMLSHDEKSRVCRFLGCTEEGFLRSFIRCAFASKSDICIVPFQDILELDSSHRMNTPGTFGGNWSWRFTPDMVCDHKLNALEEHTVTFGRTLESGVMI